eukprot:GHVS01057078.1.p1 GENE.GHVS01057078.1~~GHVS01057078.1.p1  ORF type:complete len:265 (-),score=47.92 GHVS01057078.1:92-886(-)
MPSLAPPPSSSPPDTPCDTWFGVHETTPMAQVEGGRRSGNVEDVVVMIESNDLYSGGGGYNDNCCYEAACQRREAVCTTTTKACNGSTTTTLTKQTTTTGVIRGYIPSNPYELSRGIQILLQFTELPFLILWIFFSYFIVIVILTAAKVRQLVWLNALVAALLVGIGLNANAYHAIMYRGSVDYGMVVRFFLIPFGVSALSGLTNSLRDEFMLVFPKDLSHLTIALLVPSGTVVLLMALRALALRAQKVPLTWRNLLLNGKVYT